MPLEGNIKEFGLADVIQFICNNQKDGVLQLESKTDAATASVSFEQGKITGALYGRKGKTDLLTNYLQRSHRLDTGTVQRMQRLAADSGLTMDEVMVKEGVMTGEEFQSVIAFKIQEVFDEIFTLTEANYRFDPEATLYKKSNYQVALGPDLLLLEAMRRKDEWPAIAKALPKDSLELVRSEKDVPPPAADSDDWVVFVLLDIPKSVANLIDETGLGRFRTFNACYNLLQSGAAELTGQEAALLRKDAPVSHGALHYVGRTAIAISTIGLCLALLAGAFSLGHTLAQRIVPRERNVVQNVAVTLQRESLEQQIEVFRLVSGRLPVNLREAGANLGMINNFAYSANDSTNTFTLEVRK